MNWLQFVRRSNKQVGRVKRKIKKSCNKDMNDEADNEKLKIEIKRLTRTTSVGRQVWQR